MKIFYKIFQIFLLFLFLISLYFVLQKFLYKEEIKIDEDYVKKQIFTLANSIGYASLEPLINKDELSLSEIITRFKNEIKEIKEIGIIDTSGIIIAHLDVEKFGKKISKHGDSSYLEIKDTTIFAEVPVSIGEKVIGKVCISIDKSFVKIPFAFKNIYFKDFIFPILAIFLLLLSILFSPLIEKREFKKILKDMREREKRLESEIETLKWQLFRMLEHKPQEKEMEKIFKEKIETLEERLKKIEEREIEKISGVDEEIKEYDKEKMPSATESVKDVKEMEELLDLLGLGDEIEEKGTVIPEIIEKKESEVKFEKIKIEPNPYIIGKGNLKMTFECDAETKLTVKIIKENKIYKEILINTKIGAQTIEWDGKIGENEYIQPGNYIFSFSHADKVIFQRRIIIKA